MLVAGWHASDFLKLFLCRHLYVCVFVCPPPKLLITSDVMWHDMDSCFMATVVSIISGHGLGIDMLCMVCLLIFVGIKIFMDFVGFLIHDNLCTFIYMVL